MKKIICLAMALVFITSVSEAAAGYIRPGGGNDVIQIVLSSIVSVGAFFKSAVNRIKSLFSGAKRG